MSWYDAFAHVYDPAIEWLYRGPRAQAFDELGRLEGRTVLDLACGTGQNLPELVRRCGDSGRVLGVDVSAGMLAKARRRVERAGWRNVDLFEVDARELFPTAVSAPPGGFDVAVCTLGLSAIPEWESVFASAFELVRPGGQFLIMDVWAERRVPQTLSVELIARADLRREVWRPLEAASVDFSMKFLPGSAHVHGGRLLVAVGRRPVHGSRALSDRRMD